MQSFDLSLGFYAVLGKPVAHDLALILCQLFPFPACQLLLSMLLLFRILQSSGGVEAFKSDGIPVIFLSSNDKVELVIGGDA